MFGLSLICIFYIHTHIYIYGILKQQKTGENRHTDLTETKCTSWKPSWNLEFPAVHHGPPTACQWWIGEMYPSRCWGSYVLRLMGNKVVNTLPETSSQSPWKSQNRPSENKENIFQGNAKEAASIILCWNFYMCLLNVLCDVTNL